MSLLTDSLDINITAIMPVWITKQNAYAVLHGGRFWQGIINPAVIPSDGTNGTLDNTQKPSYQAEDWNDFAIPLPSTKCAWQADQYNAPDGRGWALTTWVVEATIVKHRTINVGPASNDYRTTAGWL